MSSILLVVVIVLFVLATFNEVAMEIEEQNDEIIKTQGEFDFQSSGQTTRSNELFKGYREIHVPGGSLSGEREALVVVNIGFGDRKYYGFTNEYGQLVRVIAREIILQNPKKEPLNSKGRYYNDEAKVKGTERSDLDEGHVIADSLGGVANAYNITPQNKYLNRQGAQAKMEDEIRKAGGCTDFLAIITYEDTKTQIPNHYSFSYRINGKLVKREFDNVGKGK